jgi:peptidyl-prolyl cis-trans isomerase C
MVKEVHARHILVKTEAQCKDLLVQIKSGKNFGDLAKTYSDCPSGKKGGDLGWFTKNKMVKEFEVPAFAGKKGDICGPFKSQFGWHLMEILDQK